MITNTARSVAIASCDTLLEAKFLKNLLESSGVKSVISADDYAGLPLLTSGGVQLLVVEEDVAFARTVLQEAHF
jgi:hypothetical protein